MRRCILLIALLSCFMGFAQDDAEMEAIAQRYNLEELTISGKVKLKKGDKIRLDNLNFFGGTANLLPGSEPVLKELLKIMTDNPNLMIQIQGHICCYDEGWNQVSSSRAQFVWDYLKRNGINKKRISYKDMGGKHPIYPIPEATEAQREYNRRVEFEVISNDD